MVVPVVSSVNGNISNTKPSFGGNTSNMCMHYKLSCLPPTVLYVVCSCAPAAHGQPSEAQWPLLRVHTVLGHIRAEECAYSSTGDMRGV